MKLFNKLLKNNTLKKLCVKFLFMILFTSSLSKDTHYIIINHNYMYSFYMCAQGQKEGLNELRIWSHNSLWLLITLLKGLLMEGFN